MDPPAELVSFVTRAENRVEVLLALASGARTRPELQADTGIPRTTLSRILADFRDRELATRDGHRYRATPLGRRLSAGLEELFDAVASTRALQTLTASLPLEDLGVDFDRFADAEVTLPTPFDPMAPVKRAARVVESAAHVRTFCYSVLHAPILAALQAVVHEGQRLEGIVADGVLQVVAEDAELAGRARELLASEHVTLHRYDGGIEPQLVIADGTTMFLVADTDGAIQGLVETDDETVLPWAEALFESLRDAAEPVDPASLPAPLTS